jgi:hypothetical protein
MIPKSGAKEVILYARYDRCETFREMQMFSPVNSTCLLSLFTYYRGIMGTVYKDDNQMQLSELRATCILICMHWYFKPARSFTIEGTYPFADRRLSRGEG